jgi:hypothetical protein
MGISYYTCPECGHNFADCSNYASCFDDRCITPFCNDSCLEKHGGVTAGYDEENGQYVIFENLDDKNKFDGETGLLCGFCSKKAIVPQNFIQWICDKYNLNYNELQEEYKKQLISQLEYIIWKPNNEQ